MTTACKENSDHPSRRRGVALLLVMLALIVGMILTAGFLATEGTAIGIAANERDQNIARGIAESGDDMCAWLVKNQSGWRSSMSPGTWINTLSINGGTVTVSAVDGAGNSSFATDPTQPVVFTSVATYNNRTYTVGESIGPSGGGAVWGNGAFSTGNISLSGSAYVDSYDSAGIYTLTHSANAMLTTNSISNNAFSMTGFSSLMGGVTAGPSATLNNVISLLNSILNPPSSQATASAAWTLGNVIPPNTAGFTLLDTISQATGNTTYTRSGYFSAFSTQGFLIFPQVITVGSSGSNITVWVKNSNLTVGSNSYLVINGNVTMLVDGNASIQGQIQLDSGSKLTLIVAGSIDVNGGAINTWTPTPSACIIQGTSTSNSINIHGSSSVYAGIYTPQAAAAIYNSSQLYGGIVANQLSVQNSGQLHLDSELSNVAIHNITDGSAPPSQPDYTVEWTK